MANVRTHSLVWTSVLFVLAPALASAAHYELDSAHSEIGFGVRHVGISTVRGNFQSYSGKIEFDPTKPAATQVDIEINADSIDTRNAKRDEHVKSGDFLDTKQFPKITFKSKSVKSTGKASYEVAGDLTLHGVTKPVTLKVTEFAGPGVNPLDKKNHIGGTATATIVRQDFGLAWNGGGVKGLAGEAAVGNDVKLQIDLDAVATDAPADKTEKK